LQDYTRLKRVGGAADRSTRDDFAWSLVLDSLIFAAEAEVRWLDHCEARVRRAATEVAGPRRTAADAANYRADGQATAQRSRSGRGLNQ
jgi:hypothetical protein